LTSAFHGGEWSASRPGRFTHRQRALVPIGGVQSLSGRDGEEKNFQPPPLHQESNPRTPIV